MKRRVGIRSVKAQLPSASLLPYFRTLIPLAPHPKPTNVGSLQTAPKQLKCRPWHSSRTPTCFRGQTNDCLRLRCLLALVYTMQLPVVAISHACAVQHGCLKCVKNVTHGSRVYTRSLPFSQSAATHALPHWTGLSFYTPPQANRKVLAALKDQSLFHCAIKAEIRSLWFTSQ